MIWLEQAGLKVRDTSGKAGTPEMGLGVVVEAPQKGAVLDVQEIERLRDTLSEWLERYGPRG